MSIDNKFFKVAGVSAVKGQYKVRFANDMARVKVLIKTNHTNIELMELPSAMSKHAIVTFLKTTSLMNNPVYREAIEAADVKYNSSVKSTVTKITKQAKTTRSKKSTPSLADIRARIKATKTSNAPADMLGEAIAALVAESHKNSVS
jgi:hypothetical protein